MQYHLVQLSYRLTFQWFNISCDYCSPFCTRQIKKVKIIAPKSSLYIKIIITFDYIKLINLDRQLGFHKYMEII